MTGDRSPPRQTPVWVFFALAVLFALAGFGYGVQVGRDVAVARPEAAAGLDRYTDPLLFGCLAGAVGLSIWLGGRGRAGPGAAADGGGR